MSSPKDPHADLDAILKKSARLKEDFDKLNEQMRTLSREIFETQEQAIQLARKAEKDQKKIAAEGG